MPLVKHYLWGVTIIGDACRGIFMPTYFMNTSKLQEPASSFFLSDDAVEDQFNPAPPRNRLR